MRIVDILNFVTENVNSAFFYTPNIYPGAESYILKKPDIMLQVCDHNELDAVLKEVDILSGNDDFIGLGIIPYETGNYFQSKTIDKSRRIDTELSGLNFCFYNKNNCEIIKSDHLIFSDVEDCFKSEYNVRDYHPGVTKQNYLSKIRKIKKYISIGDCYQINYTTKAKFKFEGDVSALFLRGIFNQSAKYPALINLENHYIVSFSPELFFQTDYRTILCKPMKGTLRRGETTNEDSNLAKNLLNDEKNLAENVMIVDLLRNDIGKIAKIDTVKVRKLYEIEKYETLFQLTSTISGILEKNSLSTIIKNLFPCGSVTGAPKIRAMEIISDIESAPREIYTGSIGLITSKKSVFNIAIRTLCMDKKTHIAELGLGGGIVWDSKAENEYDEMCLKGEFINQNMNYFELLETLLFEKGNYFLLDSHLQRLTQGAEYFLFKLDLNRIISMLEEEAEKFLSGKNYKVRLLLNKWGEAKIESEEVEDISGAIKVIIATRSEEEHRYFYYHKTTYRPWDSEYKMAKQNGYDEVLFINRQGFLLEGALSNLFIKKNQKIYTPPLNLGLLNGCYRQNLIQNKNVDEKILTLKDLQTADEVFITNSVRKEIIVDKIYDMNTKLVYEKKN